MRALLVAHWPWLAFWVGAWSLVAFCGMAFDKRRAKNGGWRVRERQFFLFSALGGALGAVLGMHAFHHKTRHWYFKYGLPGILILQAGLVAWVLWR